MYLQTHAPSKVDLCKSEHEELLLLQMQILQHAMVWTMQIPEAPVTVPSVDKLATTAIASCAHAEMRQNE